MPEREKIFTPFHIPKEEQAKENNGFLQFLHVR